MARDSHQKSFHSFPPNVHDIRISVEAEEGFAKPKALILSLIIIAGLGAYWLWRQTPIDNNGVIVCIEGTRSCPDGSSVSRMGPQCEFAKCPETRNAIGTSDYKTYRNEEYGFEFDYHEEYPFKGGRLDPLGAYYVFEVMGPRGEGEVVSHLVVVEEGAKDVYGQEIPPYASKNLAELSGYYNEINGFHDEIGNVITTKVASLLTKSGVSGIKVIRTFTPLDYRDNQITSDVSYFFYRNHYFYELTGFDMSEDVYLDPIAKSFRFITP